MKIFDCKFHSFVTFNFFKNDISFTNPIIRISSREKNDFALHTDKITKLLHFYEVEIKFLKLCASSLARLQWFMITKNMVS